MTTITAPPQSVRILLVHKCKCANAQLDKLETARFKATTETLQTHNITLDNEERLMESLRS